MQKCLLTMLLLMGCMYAISTQAHIHVSPDGTTVRWYPRECCNEGDCRPVKHKLVYGANGVVTHVRMLVQGKWETYAIGRTLPSKDKNAHWCGVVVDYIDAPGRFIDSYCRFVPKGQV